MMAEGSLECSKPSACPSSCTATRKTSLPRGMSTPSNIKAREKSGAYRRKTTFLYLHEPTVASPLSPKWSRRQVHVMTCHRSRPLMLPNMLLLRQKLALSFCFPSVFRQMHDSRPDLSLQVFLAEATTTKKSVFLTKVGKLPRVAITRYRLLPNRSLFPIVHGSVASKWVSPPMPGPGK